MSNVLRIKRRLTGASGAPSSLYGGELAYNEINDVLYIGKGDNGSGLATSVVAVAGSGIGAVDLTSNQSIGGTKTFTSVLDVTGTFKLDGSAVSASAAEINVLDGATAGTAVASKAVVLDANKDFDFGTGDIAATDVTVRGNLTVQGTTTQIDTTNLNVKDKNITIADVASPSDITADGAGITVKGATDKTLNWVDSSDAWTSSEHMDLASGKVYKINGTQVLSGSALGSGVTSSSLTSVATISSGTWQGTAVAVAYGGTGASDASGARSNLGLVIGTDVQAYDAELAAIAGLTSAADKGIYFTGSGSASVFDLSSFGRTLAGSADAAAARSSLSLVVGTDVQAYDAELAAIAGLTSDANKGIYFTGSGAAATYDLSSFGRTLAGSADAAAARSSLGLVIGTDVQAYDAELAAIAGLTSAADKGIYFTGSGSAATYDLSSFGRSLVDDADASAARTTLGLGSIATQSASNVSITGGSIDGVTIDGGSF